MAKTNQHQKIERISWSCLLLSLFYPCICYHGSATPSVHRKRTEKGVPFIWMEDAEEAFKQLKRCLARPPIQAYPDMSLCFILHSDASNSGIGGVLSQQHDGEERVIAYYSAALSCAERNYCVTRKELLAVVKAVKHFQPYLYGREFLLRTDHAALRWLLKFRNPEGQLARWLETLQQYQFIIEHRSGARHGNADALSRRPCYDDGCKHCARLDSCQELETTTTQTLTMCPLLTLSPQPSVSIKI